MDQLKNLVVVAAGICSKQNKLLLSERKPGTHLEGHWEFPGGKVRPDESPEAALSREWYEELGVEVRQARSWNFVYQAYDEKNILLLFFRIDIEGVPSPREGQQIAWLTMEECRRMRLPAGDARALDLLSAENDSDV